MRKSRKPEPEWCSSDIKDLAEIKESLARAIRENVEWRAFDDFEDLQEDPAALGLVRAFYLRTQGREFSSDTFRELHLHEAMSRPDRAIGGIFSMLTRLRLVIQTGWIRSRIPSNNRRKIRTYRWTDLAREGLGE